MGFAALLKEVRACTLHEKDLPLGPRLAISMHPGAHIINSYVPGIKVHETGIAWNDPSGERLLDWTLMNGNIFYDAYRIAIMPMGFCCPGRLARGGNKPPRPKRVPAGHDRVLEELPKLKHTFLVKLYAQAYYLGDLPEKTQASRVKSDGPMVGSSRTGKRGGVTKSTHLSRLALSSQQCCAFFSPLCARQFPGWRCIYLRRKSRDCPPRSKHPALR